MSSEIAKYFHYREYTIEDTIEVPDEKIKNLVRRFPNGQTDASAPQVLWSRLPPNHVTPVHSHGCDLIYIVLEGEVRFDKDTVCKAKGMRMVAKDLVYGPETVGPQGALVMIIAFGTREEFKPKFV